MGIHIPATIKASFVELGWEDPPSRQRWWILLRWVLVGVIVLATVVGNRLINLHIPAFKVLPLCAIAFLLNLFLHHRFHMNKRVSSLDSRSINRFTCFQVAIDWVLISVIFHYTGGVASLLLFYFLFHVILSGLLLDRRTSILYITLIAFTINTIAILELRGHLPHVYQASFMSRDAQDNPFFVLLLLFFFTTVLYISILFVGSFLKGLRERILQLTELRQRLEQANQQLALLNQVARDTTSTFGLDRRLSFICHCIMDIMGVKGTAIRLLDERTNRLELATACGLSQAYVNKGPVEADKSLARALEGEPHLVLDASTDPAVQYPEEARKEGIVSMLALPLRGRRKVIGTLRLYTGEKRSFSENELDFVSALASQGAVSIENAKIYDALERQDRAKSDFIMMMTHELKAPLMAIQGLLEVMIKGYVGALTEKQRELAQRIYRRIDSLMEVSTGLLDIYQWESRKPDAAWTPQSMREQIQRTADLFRASAEEKGVRIELALPEGDPTVIGTEEDMERILNNLITNAIKYTPRGGVISLALSATDGEIILSVRDTGIGIGPEDIPKIFDDFFRTKEAKRIDPYGRGMGMPFVKRIVENVGGTITVKSEKGKGTEFIITFPRAPKTPSVASSSIT